MTRDVYVAVVKASLASAAVSVAGVLLATLSKLALTRVQEDVLIISLAYGPGVVAAYWLFRGLRSRCSSRQAKKVALAFAMTAPVCLAVSAVIAQIPIGFAAQWNSRAAIFGAIVITLIILSTLLNVAVCSFARWLVALERRAAES